MTWQDSRDAARICDALETAADVVERNLPLLAARYRRISAELADACDASSVPRIDPPVHYMEPDDDPPPAVPSVVAARRIG